MKAGAEFWKAARFDLFEGYFIPAAATGLALLLAGFFIFFSRVLVFTGALLLIPFLVHLNVLALWHWKERYQGKHSYLWGAFLIFETTGWSKLVYLFRHIFPDRKSRGQYATNAAAGASA